MIFDSTLMFGYTGPHFYFQGFKFCLNTLYRLEYLNLMGTNILTFSSNILACVYEHI